MKFKKINEHTIECIITREELQDYGISMEDLVKSPEKTNEFVHKVVSLSQKEIGFKPDNSVLQAQLMPCDEGLIMVVFDKPTEKLGEYFLGQLKKRILRSLDDSNHDDEHEDNSFEDMSFLSDIEEMMKGEQKLEAGDDICYLFLNFENLMDFIRNCVAAEGMKSQLYYQDRTYFMIMSKGMDEDGFKEVCRIADEYGYISASCDERVQLIKEHTKPVIARNAIGELKKTIF